MSGYITEIYDVSFIKLMTDGSGINMSGKSLFHVGSLNFRNNDDFLYYKTKNIFNQGLYAESHKFDASLIDVSLINYESNTYKLTTNDVSINNINCQSVNVTTNFFVNNDISFNRKNIYNYNSTISDISEVSCNSFNSYEVSANNINLYNNLNVYNTCFKLNKNSKLIDINENNIITYDGSMSIGDNEINTTTIYGTLKCNTISITGAVINADNYYYPFYYQDKYGNYTTHDMGSVYFGTIEVNYLTNNSDDRLKHNETSITNALETICKIKPKTYIKNNSIIENDIIKSKRCSGYIAQDISNDIPELNHVVKNGKILALKYTEIQPYITKSIQELDVLVNNISNEINIIKKQVETIEKK